MNKIQARCAVLGTLFAGLCGLAVPAAAEAGGGDFADPVAAGAGLAGRLLGDAELADMRGLYLPPGSTVVVQIGNGDNTSTTYFQQDPATPGSASVTVVGSTSVAAFAATGGPGTTRTISRSLSTTRSFSSRF